ncbi:MAG TPA: HAD family phosphatase [Verrucomicrobiae bacterium]|nr:HAD family phosphatase [Verrucomicrobiae bacterium]
MIQAVVFDLGKVLVDFDYGIAAQKIAARGKMNAQDIVQFLATSPLLYRYETGLVTNEQFYREVCDASGFCGSQDEFGETFGDVFTPIEPMIQIQAELRRRSIPTYIFSNTNELAVRHIRRSFPFFKHFNGYILSYEHGWMKPDPKLYEVVEKQTGRRGADLLYVDDRPENIATGAARGWQTILQETPEKTREAMQKLGIPTSALVFQQRFE